MESLTDFVVLFFAASSLVSLAAAHPQVSFSTTSTDATTTLTTSDSITLGTLTASTLSFATKSVATCNDAWFSSLSALGPEATAFCSGWLNISDSTATATVVNSTTASPPTTTATLTLLDTTSSYVTTVTVTGNATTYTYNGPNTFASNITTAPETMWGGFGVAEATDTAGIKSSICSCFSITPSVTTEITSTLVTVGPSTTFTSLDVVFSTTTVEATTTTTVAGPTVSSCFDFEHDVNNVGYQYLSEDQANQLSKWYGNSTENTGDWVNCCNTCYQRQDCVVYRFSNSSAGNRCELWTTKFGTSLNVSDIIDFTNSTGSSNSSKFCPHGIVEGTRQEINGTGSSNSPIAIGPCLNAVWEVM
ncbi:uncharacterized protein J3D65DRAFT_610931 [Phyllosticta citribraziliensis]|uniref:Apple domain-containing protein n=1 Tax=Phyllosticta citribraziliensis TaxID=989973 RepID=A0ABR1MC27_9PEZI